MHAHPAHPKHHPSNLPSPLLLPLLLLLLRRSLCCPPVAASAIAAPTRFGVQASIAGMPAGLAAAAPGIRPMLAPPAAAAAAAAVPGVRPVLAPGGGGGPRPLRLDASGREVDEAGNVIQAVKVPVATSLVSAVLCCAVLCCAVLCCAVLCCAVLCCAVLCCAVLCCAVVRLLPQMNIYMPKPAHEPSPPPGLKKEDFIDPDMACCCCILR
jgi:hypothetical protein